MTISRTKVLYLLGGIVVLLVAFWLRVADLKDIPPGIYYDEGRIMQRVWRLTHGYNLPMYFQDEEEPTDALIRAVYMEAVGGSTSMFVLQTFSVWLNLLAVATTITATRFLYHKQRYRRVIALAAGMTLAVMPPSAIIGRHLYRSNWLPFILPLALIFWVWCWRRNRPRDFFIAGILTALPALFYLGGVFIPPAVVLILLLTAAVTRFRWPSRKNLLLAGLGFGLTMIPWLVLYLTIPNWLVRVGDLADQYSPLKNPAILFGNIKAAVLALFVPDTIHDMRYNTFTTAFLNPALIVLFGIGLLVSLRRWKTPLFFAPVLIGLVMLVPNILSSEPYQAHRLIGTFIPLALVTGLGAGEVLALAAQKRAAQTIAQVALAVIFIGSPIYTAYNIWYHFEVQPLLTDPTRPESFALKYRIGFKNLLEGIAASDQPTYLPIEYLNTDLAVDVLRPSSFPTARAYDGRPMPAGKVILPINSIEYGFFLLDHTPVQYGLLIPKTGEILILPPLTPADADALETRTRDSGQNVLNEQGWILGQSTEVTDDDNPFQHVQIPPATSLGVFDGNLELVAIDAPQNLTPGKIAPITLYWRVREKTGKDYFSRLQVWDYQNMSRGYERGSPLVKEPDFPLNILYNIYPTVMWQPGEIVADTRWIPVFPDAPAGGYRFAVGVYDYPGPTPVTYDALPGVSEGQDNWLITGLTGVGLDSFTSQPNGDIPVNAQLGEGIRLTGYRTDTALDALKPGETLTVHLDWQIDHPVGVSYTIFLHLTDAAGNIVAQSDSLPFGGALPTWAWMPGVTISTEHTLNIQSDSQPPYALTAGMYSYPSLQRLAVIQDGVASPDNLVQLTNTGQQMEHDRAVQTLAEAMCRTDQCSLTLTDQ